MGLTSGWCACYADDPAGAGCRNAAFLHTLDGNTMAGGVSQFCDFD